MTTVPKNDFDKVVADKLREVKQDFENRHPNSPDAPLDKSVREAVVSDLDSAVDRREHPRLKPFPNILLRNK
jgi:hypothetical protein